MTAKAALAMNETPHATPEEYVVAAFYRFVKLPDYERLQAPIKAFCVARNIKGTILLAEEGINSTLAGSRDAVDALFAYFDEDERLRDLPRKEHICDFQPFQKMKVRLKKEIVRMNVPSINHVRPEETGTYVKPEEWDALISDPDTIVVDTRNHYEVQLGTFKGAIDPMTEEFRSFPEWVEENLAPEKNKKVAMFCTGGIRCEKSTALLKDMGFENVYHLEGGILQYLEDTGNKNEMWEGDCFVFDDRVAVNDKLEPSEAPLCKHCGQPVKLGGWRPRDHNHRGIAHAECEAKHEKNH